MLRFRALLRQTPIGWVILGYYLAILLITLGLLCAGVYAMLSRYLVRSNETRLRITVESDWFRESDDAEHRHRVFWEGLPAPPDFPRGIDDFTNRCSGRGVFVRVLDDRGQVLSTCGHFRRPPGVDLARIEQLRALISSGQRLRVSYFFGERGDWLVLLMPIMREGKMVGVLQVGGPYWTAREMLSALSGYFILGGLVAAVLAAAMAVLVARFLAFPIERMMTATRRVRAGDLSARTGLQEGRNEIYAVASAFDRMVAQLQESFEAQRRFVGDASHELKTPLTAIGGMAEVLRVGADRGNPEQREKALATIEKEVDRMSRLVSDLLTLSRAEQTGLAKQEVVNLKTVAHEVVTECQLLGPQHRFQEEMEGDLKVHGDADQLGRVLRNLVENAVHYSPAGSTVTVRGHKVGSEVIMEISDQGTGIAAEDLPHIFERFYRADRSRARKTGGSGLGLAIVRALVEQHGGRVTAASGPQGTTVTVGLPV